MYTSFTTALSGLNANSAAIDVIGNNLANLNTTGYKTNVVSFHDLVTQSLGGGLGQTQIGVGRPTTFREFTQGALQTTSGPLDAAIQGDGFFIVKNSDQAIQYTRAGNFQVNHDGFLVAATGERIQGWALNNGVLDSNSLPGDINVPIGSISAPVATKSISFDMNLDASASAGPPAATFSTSLQVYDSLGSRHTVTAKFTKNATPGQWDYSISVPDSDLKSPFTPVTGSLTFDPQGKLLTPAATDPQPQIPIQGFVDGAADLPVSLSLFNGTAPRITQFSKASAVSGVAQDGLATAQLIRVGIGDNGQILAQYSDGQQQAVGQVAMALVRNPQSLIAAGDNNFQASGLTALAAVGIPGTGGRGNVAGGSLESSTVDIAREFTNLIVFQRGYQANAKVITTIDEISQDTINLKR